MNRTGQNFDFTVFTSKIQIIDLNRSLVAQYLINHENEAGHNKMYKNKTQMIK